jgi:prevent-host-death family protein
MTMKQVRVADLKARLSEHLRYVRRGHSLTVLDRDTPIARVVPIEATTALTVRAGTGTRLGAVPLPPPIRLRVDPVALLLQDRQSER